MRDGQLTTYGRPTWVLATTPLVGDGLQVGDLWVDLFIPVTKRCTSISPVTFATVEGGGGGGGETNTASNVGTTGTSVVEGKVGVDLQFRSVTAASNKLTVTNNAGNKSVDIDVAQANLSLGSIGGSASYSQIQNVSATDKILGRSSAGAGVIQEITCTAAGRALLDDADAAAQRTTLGLSVSPAFTGTMTAETIQAELFKSLSADATISSSTPTSILTLPTGNNALYIVTAHAGAQNDVPGYTAYAIVGVDDADTRIIHQVNGTGMFITVTPDIACEQTTGSSQQVYVTATRVA